MEPASEMPYAELAFQRLEIVTGPAKHQTLLTGFLTNRSFADLAVISIHESGERQLAVHSLLDSGWERVIDVPLSREVLFVDVAQIAGRDRLLTYENGRLKWFDPDDGVHRVLVDVALDFSATRGRAIAHVDITEDLNGDGLDDVVVPSRRGFWISLQSSDGAFAAPALLGPTEPFLDAVALDDQVRYREVGLTPTTIPWYLSRVYRVDWNHDGRTDLVFWNKDHFDVHLQDEEGAFDSTALTAMTAVPFDADGDYTLTFGYQGENMARLVFGLRKRSTQVVLSALRDMNDDGIADLVTHSLAGRSVMRQRSTYQVHFGSQATDGTRFPATADAAFRTKGKSGALQASEYGVRRWEDVDGDNQVDLLLLDAHTTVPNAISALVRQSVTMDFECHRMRDRGFPETLSTQRGIQVDFDAQDDEDGMFFAVILVGDVTGDGRSDLLVGPHREELHIYRGVPEPHVFALHPQVLAVAMPNTETLTWLADFNGDAMQDILMHHPSATGDHRVTLLIPR